MKAAIVKNDNFETVGFEIKEGKTTFFSWGISPQSPFCYVKTTEIDPETAFKIIELGILKDEYDHEVDQLIMDTITDSGYSSFKFARLDAKKDKIESNLVALIKSVK